MMEATNDVHEFLQILTRLNSSNSSENTAVFKEKYQVAYLNYWKPWYDAPSDLTQNCFIICYHKEELQKIFFNESINNSGLKSFGYYSSGEFIGNPLDFELDISVDETSPCSPNIIFVKCGLSLNDSRYICDLLAEIIDDSIKNIPVYIFCDGKDDGKTILLGKSGNIRVLGVTKGILNNQDQYVKHEFKEEHFSGLPPSFCSEVEEKVHAYFVILGSSTSVDYSSLKSSRDAFLALECSSPVISQILQISSLNSTCNMILKIAANEEYILDISRFKELKFLKALFDCLSTGEMVWPVAASNVAAKLHNFFIGLKKNVNFTQEKYNYFNINMDSPFYFNADRKDMDFTDHLWYILMDCSSYDELSSCLNDTFDELKDMTFTPHVHKNNKTNIAQVAQKNCIMLPCLQSTKPIELLLEIGIEKLCKDYIQLLVGCEMVPFDVLSPFLKLCKDFDGAVKCLSKLHIIMEMVLIVSSHLMLPKNELSQFVRTVLNCCKSSSKLDSSCIFKFPVCMNSVKGTLAKIYPTVWCASMKNFKDDFKKQSFLIYNKKFDELEYSHMKGSTCLNSPSCLPYYVTKYTIIHDNYAPKENV